LDVDGRIILKPITERDSVLIVVCIYLASSCEDGNDFSGSIRGRKFLEQLNDYKLHSKGSAP
jgi:hypothetical protein